MSSLPWVPLQGPLELLAALDRRWTVAVCTSAGLVLGLVVAVGAIVESLTVALTDTGIRLRRNGRTRAVARSDVDAVFLDGKRLVVLDRASRQVVRDRPEATAAEVERAFRAHGYPWRDRDPYTDLYRRWVPDTPNLPPSVNAVLAAREVMLRGKLDRDVAELRDEVQELGFTVRDEQFRQYWRPLVRS